MPVGVRGLGLVYVLGRGGPYLCVLVQTRTDQSGWVDVCIVPMDHACVGALRDTLHQMSPAGAWYFSMVAVAVAEMSLSECVYWLCMRCVCALGLGRCGTVCVC